MLSADQKAKYEARLAKGLAAAREATDYEGAVRAMEDHGFARGESKELLPPEDWFAANGKA